MSTGVLSLQTRLRRAERDLEDERALREQAERAQKTAEEVARRAEERATELESERDGWAGFAYELLTPRLRYFDPDLSHTKICQIGDLAYDLHAQGTDVDDDTLLAGLVNDWTEQ